MEQVLVYLKNEDGVKLCVLPYKQRELVALGKALLKGNKRSIEKHVISALDANASREEIIKVVEFIVGDKRLLRSIIELFRILRYEENRRAKYISVVDDVRE